jgi:site-specific DNA-methyltransferase (adenine-specific)
MAWTSFDCVARLYKKININPKKIHPTQKPVKLYEWLLMNYAKEGDTILDTHLGSGSIAIACHNLGFELTGYEIDKEYFEAAKKRIEQHKQQGRLW